MSDTNLNGSYSDDRYADRLEKEIEELRANYRAELEENDRLREALEKVDAYLTTLAVPRPDWLITTVRNALNP